MFVGVTSMSVSEIRADGVHVLGRSQVVYGGRGIRMERVSQCKRSSRIWNI